MIVAFVQIANIYFMSDCELAELFVTGMCVVDKCFKLE